MSLINEALKDLDARTDDVEGNAGSANGSTAREGSSRNPLSTSKLSIVVFSFVVFGIAGGVFFYGANAPEIKSVTNPIASAPTSSSKQSSLEQKSVGSIVENVAESAGGIKSIDSVENNTVNTKQNAQNQVKPKKSETTIAQNSGNEVVQNLASQQAAENLNLSVGEKADTQANTRVVKFDNKDAPASQTQEQSTSVVVGNLLRKADKALASGRLTRPENDNALFYILAALQNQPNAPAALDRQQELLERYAAFVQTAIDEKNSSRLARLLARAETLDLALSDKPRYYASLQQMQERAHKAPSPAQPLSAPSVSIQKTLDTQDKQIAEHELKQYQSGFRTQAIANLESFLLEHPGARRSRLTLFDIYLQQSNTASALRLISSVSHDKYLQSYLQARILVAEGNLPAARSMLETVGQSAGLSSADLSSAATAQFLLQERVDSLLAAIYQSQLAYELALRKYKSLLRRNRNSADYWLGTALSADALEFWSDALTAYTQVLSIGSSDKAVDEYARKRIKGIRALVEQQKLAGSTGS